MVRTDIPTVHVLLVFPAREGKNGLAPGVLAGLDIALGITHKVRVAGDIDRLVDRLERLDNIPDPGLAAMTAGGRLAGAVENILDLRPGRLDAFKHVRGDQVELGLRENPFTDAGLVRDHKYMIPGIRQPLERFERPRQEMETADFGDVKPVAGEFIDDAVSVKENDFHSFFPSLMPLMIS